jgi:hypothetical protein
MPKMQTGTRVPDSLPVQVPGSKIPENPIPNRKPLPASSGSSILALKSQAQITSSDGMHSVNKIHATHFAAIIMKMET